MKITILNPDDLKNLFELWGSYARICYQSSPGKEEAIGKHCFKSGHYSGSRSIYIKFLIEDIDRGTAEQIMRTDIGQTRDPEEADNWNFSHRLETHTDINPTSIVKNCLSFRYVDETGFTYYTPPVIERNEKAKTVYKEVMKSIDEGRSKIKQALIDSGVDEHKATEDANFVLPRATTTSLCIGFTVEALLQFCHKRLCARAQEGIREVAKVMKKAVAEYCPSLAKELVPQCDYLLYCPESKGCGRAPSKETVRSILKQQKNGEA